MSKTEMNIYRCSSDEPVRAKYILDIKGVVIYEDEWDDSEITITRGGHTDTLKLTLNCFQPLGDDTVELIYEEE